MNLLKKNLTITTCEEYTNEDNDKESKILGKIGKEYHDPETETEEEKNDSQNTITFYQLVNKLFKLYFTMKDMFSKHLLLTISTNIFILLHKIASESEYCHARISEFKMLFPRTMENPFTRESSFPLIPYISYLILDGKKKDSSIIKNNIKQISLNEIAIWFFLKKITEKVEIVLVFIDDNTIYTKDVDKKKDRKNDENEKKIIEKNEKQTESELILNFWILKEPDAFLYTQNLQREFILNADIGKGEDTDEGILEARELKLKYFFNDVPNKSIQIAAENN